MALRLARDYPSLSQLPCSECQQFIYTIPDAKPETYELDGVEQKIPRQTPPPCNICPKESPELEDQYRLNWRNAMVLTLYERLQTGCYALPRELASDPVLADKLWHIGNIMAEEKRKDDAAALAINIARIISG